MQNSGQSMPGQRFDQDMNVIRHNHMLIQDIALAVKEMERVTNDSGIFPITQQAGTTARIQEILVPFGEKAMIVCDILGG